MEWHPEWRKVDGFDFKDIIYEKKYFPNGGVGRITMNRPQRYNSMTNVGFQEIVDAVNDISLDESIGVGVITGAGDRAFCTGGDVEWEHGGGSLRQISPPGFDFDRAIQMCRKPIIAAVNGYAIGGGNHLAYVCDFTIAGDNAIFGQNGPRVASPADGALVAYLTNVIGAKRAREIWMLCRRYTASEALQWGLINKVVPFEQLEAEVDKWCQEILDKSPSCITILKHSFYLHYASLCGWQYYVDWAMFPHHFESEEFKEATKAFVEKRQPDFGKVRRARVATWEEGKL